MAKRLVNPNGAYEPVAVKKHKADSQADSSSLNETDHAAGIKQWMCDQDIKLTDETWQKLADHGFCSIEDLTSLTAEQALDSFKTEVKIKTADLWKLQRALNLLANKKNFIDPAELEVLNSMKSAMEQLENETNYLKMKKAKIAEYKNEALRFIDDKFQKLVTCLQDRNAEIRRQVSDLSQLNDASIDAEIQKHDGVICDVRGLHESTHALLNTAISLEELNDRKSKIIEYEQEMREKIKSNQEAAVQINEKVGCQLDTQQLMKSANETGKIFGVASPLLTDLTKCENGSVDVAWKTQNEAHKTERVHIEYVREGKDDDAKWTETVFECTDTKKQTQQSHAIEVHEAGVFVFRVRLYFSELQTFSPYSNVKSIRIEAADVWLSASVILDEQEKNTLLQWMVENVLQNDKDKQLKLSLLYRMSRDGRDMSVVHSKYYGKGPTLTIMQSRDYNHVCGGYTSKDWKAADEYASKDENAFIFLLRSQFGHQPKILKPKDKGKAVYHQASRGPSWGTGCVLRIYPQAEYDAYSNPAEKVYDVTGNELLGGAKYNNTNKRYEYWLQDYEVFQVSVGEA